MSSQVDENELMAILPPSVRSSIGALEKGNLDWDRVGLALATTSSAGVALKGGAGFTNNLWLAAKKQFAEFLCTDSSQYKDIREQVFGAKKANNSAIVSALTLLVAKALGANAGVITPIIIWLLVVLSRIGKEALCEALKASSAF